MTPGARFDLTQVQLVKPALKSRGPQFVLQVIGLCGFVFAIVAGFVSTPVGSHNLGIVLVWIAWWALLMLVAVPFLGRGWCSICPIPLPGEWLQRGALLGPGRKGFGLHRRWPNRLRNIWLQNGAFVGVALFSTVVLTEPRVTAAVLAAFLFMACAASLLYERRAFCRYLCPVGGFIGLYAQAAPLEVRVKDAAICAAHTEKTCYLGSAAGYGCPWQVFPGGLVKNTYCGACLECLRSCPEDNVAINLRPFGADLAVATGRKHDEVCKAFIMLSSAAVYSAVMLGPWGELKSAAYAVGSPAWLGYAASFLLLTFGIGPGLFFIAVRAGLSLDRSRIPARKAFIAFAYSLVPLGLLAWVAFSLSFVFTNFSYVWPALSDPFGWGWNLFGTASLRWTPYLTPAVPFLQSGALLLGVTWAASTARRIAVELNGSWRLALPVAVYSLGVTMGLLWLLVG